MKEVLSKYNVAYLYIDVCESVGKLKLFLKLRDSSDAFETVRREHRVGIPCLVVDDIPYFPDGAAQTEDLIKNLSFIPGSGPQTDRTAG